VEHVFVDGRQVIASGAPTLADAARIRADAQRAAEALWARAADDSKPERHPV
jgi:5-methylthioadenosine/S-adenosylhomocysteine deaminase